MTAIFWDNVGMRMTAIGIYIHESQKEGINTVAKSAYYRSAVILTCTLIEGLVYHLVQHESSSEDNIVKRIKEYKNKCKISPSFFNQNDVFLVLESCKDVCIGEEGVTFQDLNRYLKRSNKITDKEYNKLEYARKERNKIHVQSLNVPDVGYTKRKINKMTNILILLIDKIKDIEKAKMA